MTQTALSPAQEAFISAWIAALRSGKYRQGVAFLKQYSDGCFYHCCLGVALEISNYPHSTIQNNLYHYDNYSSVLPDDFVSQYGFRTYTAGFSVTKDMLADPRFARDLEGSSSQSFSLLNDFYGWSFDKIADFIEAYKHNIFIPVTE